jgi:hypothetical protein
VNKYDSGSSNHGIRISFKEQPLIVTPLDESGSFTVLMLIVLIAPVMRVSNPQNWCRGELQKHC